MKHPLYVAFVWHMHQPYYLDAAGGEFVLPWVRLHATKDYLHMLDVLEDYPDVHATFNMVPSLVEQLQDYIDGRVYDRAWKVSLKEHLSAEDKRYIDSLFFSISRDKFIKSYPRYWQLFRMREEAGGDLDLLGEVYWRDLIAWFNLAWIDPGWIQRDPVLRALVAKGTHFTREDIATILERHKGLMAITLTAYRRMARGGQIELTTSPYFHPILPLLIDSTSAREPSPWLRLPETRFQRRGDALAQLHHAISFHEATFGRTPSGLWPSEGAVSQELVDALVDVPQVRWMASDEVILARSLGRHIERDGWGYLSDPRFLYQPYWVRSGDHRVAMVFRDHNLSDRIGFVYKDMGGRQAAEDLMFRFACIHEAVKHDPEPYLVSVILDGENCWEHYEHNGETFLRSLYEMLSTQTRIRAVTVSEYLDQFSPRREIARLATGSWINGNLETWIGEGPQNRAWDYLYATREAMAAELETREVSAEAEQRARLAMLAAEGSDWFWWYYSHNVSDQDDLFDSLFRQHLARVYNALDLKVPAWVYTPVVSGLPKLTSRAAGGYIRPVLEDEELSPISWSEAGYIDPAGSTGAMQQGSALLKRLYFGRDEASLFVRVESHSALSGYSIHIYLSRLDAVSPNGSAAQRAGAAVATAGATLLGEVSVRTDSRSVEFNRWLEQDGWATVDWTGQIAFGEHALQVALPLDALEAGNAGALGISVALFADKQVVQRLPEKGVVVLDLRPAASEQELARPV
jgi:alpha-amylase/alpha-mannosidase (GH57 family)